VVLDAFRFSQSHNQFPFRMNCAGLSSPIRLKRARLAILPEGLVGAFALPQGGNLQSPANRVEDDRAAIREQDKPRPALNLEVQLSLFFDACSPGPLHGTLACQGPGCAA